MVLSLYVPEVGSTEDKELNFAILQLC